MNRIKRYYTALRRYNRSKGYGVHSPFAFNFIRRVLREQCPYYAYNEIRQQRRQAKLLSKHNTELYHVISYRNAKMLFRIACYFSPETILQIGTTYGVSTTTLLQVSSSSKIIFFPNEDKIEDTVYQKITEQYRDRIAVLHSLEEATNNYLAIKKSQPGFVLINFIEPKNLQATKTLVNKTIEEGGIIIMRNIAKSQSMRQLWRECIHTMTHGMTFSNYRLGIIVGLRHLPHQNFNLWF